MLSQASGYAATALGFVASAGGRPLLVKEIAKEAEIPAPYLAKIIQALSRKGLVNTQRGIGGGVTLAKDPGEISLYDVCSALDDPITQTRCMLGTAQCSDDRACPAHKFYSAHRNRQIEYLHGMSIAAIAEFESRRRTGGGDHPAVPLTDASGNKVVRLNARSG